MTDSSLLFYDLETTGLNCCFDQAIQFAAIRTDLALNELERYQFRIKLNPDILPAPRALITHRLGIHNLLENGMCEYEAMQTIHALLNTPGTISLGYNTLNYDDEVLRFSFHRNLLTPYTHQYANGCGRMDLYPMTIMYYLYQPNAINWPIHNDKISLKLEALNASNQFAAGQAHDAMTDVEVTLNLARELYQQRDTWDYLLGYFNKNIDQQRLLQLSNAIESQHQIFKEGIYVLGKIGAKQRFQAPAINLGQHLHYKNQTLWLRLDQTELSQTNSTNIAENTVVFRKKYGEPGFVLPYYDRYLKSMHPDTLALANHNKRWLQDNLDIFFAIANHYRAYQYPEIPNIDIDAALYQLPFPNNAEIKLFRQFHQASLDDKYKIIERFNHAQQQQAKRILWRNYPEFAKKHHLQDEHHKPTVDFKGQEKLNHQTILSEMIELKHTMTLDKQQADIIREYEDYLQEREVPHAPLY